MRRVILFCLIIMATTSILILSFAYAKGNGVSANQNAAADTQTVFIHSIDQFDGGLSLTADEVLWYEGEEADKQFVNNEKDAGIEQAPDGYYIINDSPKLHTLEVSKNATVLMQIYAHPGEDKSPDVIPNEKVTLQQFITIFKHNEALDLRDYPFHLTIQNGKVVKIVQQFIP